MNPNDSTTSTATPSRWLAAGVLLAAALSAITGIVSYQHGLYVARLTGSTGAVAYLVPLVPDLMIATSSVTLIEAARHGKRPPMAMAAFAAGFGWTVAQNIAGGWQGGTGGRLIAGGIPLALVLTFESLLWLLRNARRAVSPGSTAGHLNPGETVPAAVPAAAAARRPLPPVRQIREEYDCGQATAVKIRKAMRTRDKDGEVREPEIVPIDAAGAPWPSTPRPLTSEHNGHG